MSSFWERKMRTYFQHFDYNHDGYLTVEDYEEMAERFSDRGKVDDAKRQRMRYLLQQVYAIISRGVGGEKSVDKLTEADFISHFKKQMDDPDNWEYMKVTFADALRTAFTIIDADRDGFIEPREYEIFFDNIRIDPKYAEESFKTLDIDGDGKLTIEEFVSGGVEFFTTDDESLPTQVFWGPLVD